MEKPKIIFKNDNLELWHNDFLNLDISCISGKINLIITSPPYNVGIEYQKHDDHQDYYQYLMFSESWLKKAYDLLADDGRLCLNIPLDKNKFGAESVYADIVTIAKKVGFKYKTTIIWNEQNISRRTAWGSWLSASAPNIIAPVETIAVFYKKSWKKSYKGTSTINKEEFIEWTNGIWTFPGENRKIIKHPAPFPVELPRRCIKLFSYKEDIILDPFVGSGTTLLAALELGRFSIGIDIDESYLLIAEKRIKKLLNKINQVSLRF